MLNKRMLGIIGIALGEALIAVNFSIVSTSLPTIHKELGATLLQLQWMLNIFGIALCTCLVTVGRLADTYGRRRIFLIGLVGSGIASLFAGFAPHPSFIIIAQLIQGVVGAILLAVSQALMSHLFPENERGRAIGIWAAIAGVTLGIGPFLAGVIISLVGWRWIFFINVPIAILAVWFVSRFIEESKSIAHRGELDFLGMIFLALVIGSLVVGIIQGPEWGWGSIWSIICFAVFVISLPILIIVENKAAFPIIRPDFFLKKDFLLPSLSNFCLIFFMWTIFFLMPLYIQNARGDSALRAGLIMLLITGPVAIFSPMVGKWYGKVGPKILMCSGFVFLLISLIFQFFFQPTSNISLTIFASLAFGIGWVLAWGPSTTAAISALPLDVAGLASGAFTTIQEMGATIGLTITGTVFRLGRPPFMNGFYHSLYVLLLLTIIGFFTSLAMTKRNKVVSL